MSVRSSRLRLPAFIIAFFLFFGKGFATCSWTTYLYDDYEYTSVCTDIIPGKTYHNTPMNFRPHSGNLSLYFNFRDTVCLAGDLVYRRYIEVCPNLPVRISSWICTAFNAPLCDIRVRIADGNNATLDDQLSIVPGLYPSWTNYSSSAVVSTTGSIYIEIYTNIPGSNGNDLAWDELLVEYCSNYNTSPVSANVCGNGTPVSLFSFLNTGTLQTGNWQSAQPLTGGYLGMYDPTINSSGTFVYTSNMYGIPPLCPLRRDTVVVNEVPSPSSALFADTTLCESQDITLSPGTNFSAYLWSDGSTASSLLVTAPGTPVQDIRYYVTLTAPSGCSFTDSISIDYVVCSGIEDRPNGSLTTVFPNPATNFFFVQVNRTKLLFELFDPIGKRIVSKELEPGTTQLELPSGVTGTFTYRMTSGEGQEQSGKIFVERQR